MPPHGRAETYYGQVVDAEAGAPLEGAVVTVIWYRVPIVSMEGTRRFQSAQETLTDADGKFSLEASPGIDWNPFTHVRKEPDVVIFRPGYAPLTHGYVRKTNAVLPPMALRHGAVVKLPKLETREEQLKMIYDGLGVTIVPPASIPFLTKSINVQRDMLGLKPIGGMSK